MKNNGFNSEFLRDLKSRNDIVSIVSRYVKLEQKGKNFWGCCPFHSEKTPSFSVNPEGFYHCFGCKEGGDVIRFIEKMESCEFIDAVKLLAENAKMEMPTLEQNNEIALKKKKRDRLLLALDLAFKHYKDNLYLKSAKVAQDYVKLRGFTRHELEDFQIGYSSSWTDMPTYLKSKGISEQEMIEAGICQSKNGHVYDVLANRLVFPIFNSFNECIGFSARALQKTELAKYKNTAETPVFFKGKVVFGINLIKKLKNTTGLSNIIIVEGQIDVICMHRAGFKNTVACMGTALTTDHAKELKRFTNDIILCFDGDGAGVKATLRSIDILREAGHNVKVVSLPEGKDPDEIIKAHGKEFMQKQIEGAQYYMDFLIGYERKKYDLNKPEEKSAFIKSALALLSKLDDESSRQIYLDKIRDITMVPTDILRRDMKPSQNQDKKEDKKELPTRENGFVRAEKFILSSILFKKDYVRKDLNYAKFIRRLDILKITEKCNNISTLFDEYNMDEEEYLKDLVYFNFENFAGKENRYFDECVWLLCEEVLKDKQIKLNEDYKKSSDLAERSKIASEILKVTKQLKNKSLEDFYA